MLLLKGRCYSNQLILGPFKYVEVDRFHSLLWLAFGKELQYRHVNARINSGDNAATSYKNLVRFGSVTPEFTTYECVLRLV